VLLETSLHFYDPAWNVMNGFIDRERPSAVVEIAGDSTTLPEQFFPFMGPMSRYYLLLQGANAEKEGRRHQYLIGRVKPEFLKIKASLADIPKKVFMHDKTAVIINRQFTPDLGDSISALKPEKCRVAIFAGASPAVFRAALDFSLRIHPEGARSLRIPGRYPNSLIFFSSPTTAATSG